MVNWSIWPIACFTNLRYVPAEYRTLFVNFVSTGWNSYLAFKNQEKSDRIDLYPLITEIDLNTLDIKTFSTSYSTGNVDF